MYITFPESTDSGVKLLLLRRALIDWTRTNNIPHSAYIEDNEFRVRFEHELHYTQFALQWEHPRFLIVLEKIAA